MGEVSGGGETADCNEVLCGDVPGYAVWRGLVPADAIEREVGGVSQLMARMSAQLATDGMDLGQNILFRCTDGHSQTAPLQELAHSACLVSRVAGCLQTDEVYFLGDELSVIVSSASANSHCAADPQVHRFQGREVASLMMPLRLNPGPAELRLVRGAQRKPGDLARLEPDSREVVSLMLAPGDVVATLPSMLSCHGGNDSSGLLAWLRLRYGAPFVLDRTNGRAVSDAGFPRVWPLT